MTSNTRTLHKLNDYLTTPVAAFIQIDDHPALPILLRADRKRNQPLVQTHGKKFTSIEHLFYHYNKYNTNSVLHHTLYLKDEYKRLLQYIVFQEGPYSRLSAAQVLELSPEEWNTSVNTNQVDTTPVSELEHRVKKLEKLLHNLLSTLRSV